MLDAGDFIEQVMLKSLKVSNFYLKITDLLYEGFKREKPARLIKRDACVPHRAMSA